MAERELYIGVMSGTSLDGVDTALVALQDDNIELLAHHDYPIPADLKQRLLNVCIGQPTTLIAMGELEHDLGHLRCWRFCSTVAIAPSTSVRSAVMDKPCSISLPAPNLLPCKLAMPTLSLRAQALRLSPIFGAKMLRSEGKAHR